MKHSQTHYVYIVKCIDGTLYTGSTRNIKNRINAHNSGKSGAKYIRGRRPVTLVYSEVCDTKSGALKKEYIIKQLSRKKKMILIQGMIY